MKDNYVTKTFWCYSEMQDEMDDAVTAWLNERNAEGFRLYSLKGDCAPQGDEKVILYQIVVMERTRP